MPRLPGRIEHAQPREAAGTIEKRSIGCFNRPDRVDRRSGQRREPRTGRIVAHGHQANGLAQVSANARRETPDILRAVFCAPHPGANQQRQPRLHESPRHYPPIGRLFIAGGGPTALENARGLQANIDMRFAAPCLSRSLYSANLPRCRTLSEAVDRAVRIAIERGRFAA
jgi:hypothetical protein